MRLISLQKKIGEGRLEVYGCPLHCHHCTVLTQNRKDYSYENVLKFLSDYQIKKVYIGGGEPAGQKVEIVDLVRVLRRMDKEITLKTNGMDADFIKETKKNVSRYVLEILTDPADAAANGRLVGIPEDKVPDYTRSLNKSIGLLEGSKVRAWIRVIPEHIDETKIEKIADRLENVADEVVLTQFMSNAVFDSPFDGIKTPMPPEEVMMKYASILSSRFPKVMVQGNGFSHTLVQTIEPKRPVITIVR